MSSPVGLYVHIPFCHHQCAYCDFAALAGSEKYISSYLKALKKELTAYQGVTLQTIYLGGGTPTVLQPDQIHDLFTAIRNVFDVRVLQEVSIEANPESATDEVLSAYLDEGVNRVSFGLQTTRDSFLLALGRLHTVDDFYQTFARARRLGLKNINIDLMYGLPNQRPRDWATTLNDVVALHPEHVSTYGLKIEPGTKFARDNVTVDEDLQADMFLQASEIFTQQGYAHYEVSNFAKPGKKCRHNLLTWENKETIGIGVSAASYLRGRRWRNTMNLVRYLTAIDRDESPIGETIELKPGERIKESIMLALRLEKGADWRLIQSLNMAVFSQFLEQGLAFVRGGAFRLNSRGWLLSNQLFRYLV